MGKSELETLLTKEELRQAGYKHLKIGKNYYMIKEVDRCLIAYKKINGTYEFHAEYKRK